MRAAVAGSAVLAAALALAVACTGEAGMTVGPPGSTAPSGASPATASGGTASARAEPTRTESLETATAGEGTAGTGAPTTGTQRPASIGPGADIPASAMLRTSDWPGGRIRTEHVSPSALPQTEPSACQEHTAFPSDRHRYGARTRSISSDVPESGGVDEVAVRYSAGRAAQAMAEMRRVLATCHSYPDPQWPGATVSYRLAREAVAGDDSLLVLRSVTPPTGRVETEYLSVVRLGDVLLTTTSETGEATANLSVALRLATTGARRGACLRSSC